MIRSCSFVVGAGLLICASLAEAQNSAKELFIGLDGGSSYLASLKSSPGPAKPVRPKVLGLQTTVYQVFDDGGTKAVSPSTVFEGGTRIRLGFNSNKPGFLYVVNLGTTGKVTTLFPSSAGDNNQVQPGLVYQVPQQTGKSIRFDHTPGEEILLIALSESRLSAFEYGGQQIVLKVPHKSPSAAVPMQPEREQRVALASLDAVSTSRDLFVEDDGVFQTAVFNPDSDVSKNKKPLVTVIKLKHR